MEKTLAIPPEYLQQAYGSIRKTEPTAEDHEISKQLQKYMDENYPTESEENITRRSVILADLRKIFRNWVKDVCISKGLPKDMAEEAGGLVYVSGSYRLGVNEPGADIDTICIAPKHITREDFFSTLRDILLSHPKVTNLVCIEGAIVPLITFDYEEINIDLQIAILNSNTIPENLNILDDNVLVGVDGGSEKSLNGPRVTELMIRLTPNRESFISVLRIVRRWAKRRGLYSNKMGFLGGINWCILVCFVNQLYPTALPSTLLSRFFMVLSNWKWPLAIQLCKTYDAKLGLEIWSPANVRNRYHTMPILTPAYPTMNSSVSVSDLTLKTMTEEFKRASAIVEKIIAEGGEKWDELFELSDFFVAYQHYLAVDIYATKEEDLASWTGFCESRLRKLAEGLAYIRPLKGIRTFPKKFPLAFVETKAADEPQPAQGPPLAVGGACYFVAFDVDKRMLRGNNKELHIDSSVDYFKQNDLYRWPKRTENMDVKITPVAWKNLPNDVFEDLGGREPAQKLRKEHLRRKKEKAAEEEATAATASQEKEPQDEVANKRPLPEDENPNEDTEAKTTPSSSPVPATETKKILTSTTSVPKAPLASKPAVQLTSHVPTQVNKPKKKKMKISFGKKT